MRTRAGGTTLRRTRATNLKIQEFAEEKEDKDRESLDFIQTSRHNRDRPFGRTRGSDRAPLGEARHEASSENRESKFHESREQLQQKPRNRDGRNPD